jgi:hypothetical protein
MRIKHPISGDIKIISKFLLFPMRLRDETRWLERALIEYEYKLVFYRLRWVPVRFIDGR